MPNRELLFIMERQAYPNWCWAANSASISRYYDHASQWTQCRIVCNCLGRQDCCGQRIPRECDIPYYLEDALAATGNFREVITGHLPPGPLKNEVDHGRIIGTRIRWRNGDGHFVSIHGYNSTGPDLYVYIADPIYGKSYLKINDFAGNYQRAAGRWSHTYLTRSTTSMLEFTKINENLLARARELAPGNLHERKENLKYINENVNKSQDAMPHDVYVIDYDSLKGSDRPVLEKSGVRLLDSTQDGKNLIFEFSGAQLEADLQQIFLDDEYTANYKNMLVGITESFEKSKNVYEIGNVRLPELKVDAIWLHSLDKNVADKFIPLFTNEFLKSNRQYDGQTFFKLLREQVKAKKDNEDDRLGG